MRVSWEGKKTQVTSSVHKTTQAPRTHKHKHNLLLGTLSGFGSGGAIGVSTGLGLSESLIAYITKRHQHISCVLQ